MNTHAVAVGVVIVIVIGGLVGFISFEAENVRASRGSILYVGGTGGGNYSSIQAAVDAANPGDTVFVYSGTYYENVIINETINLNGENRDTTIIDGSGITNVIFVNVDFVNISGFTVKNSGSNWNDAGIKIESSSNISIIGNNVSSHKWHGIILNRSSNDSQIINNIVSNNYHGIRIYGSKNSVINNTIISNSGFGVTTSYKTIITGNTILNNGDGIHISFSDYSVISNNTISFNEESGIFAHCADNIDITENIITYNNWTGISLYSSGNNKVINNSISFNNCGIYISICGRRSGFNSRNYYNIIFRNTISFNTEMGVFIVETPGNIIYHNNFINNSNQSCDHTGWGNNSWNYSYPLGGNYWSDYYGTDLYKGQDQDQPDSDGIGDTPYLNISGTTGAIDNYPLMVPISIDGIIPSIPFAPINLQAKRGNHFVNLLWDPPPFNGFSPISNYKIYKGNTSENISLHKEIGNTLFFNDTDVINGNTYYYKVTAKNVIGEGPLSNEVSATPLGVPLSPLNLNAIAGDEFINLTWKAPTSDGGPTITNYKIYRGNNSGNENFLTKIGTEFFYNDTNVTNDITYYYQVRAVNAIGEGPLSNEVSATPVGLPSIVPSIIINDNWIIKGTEIYINETIVLNGNLTIENGGCLTFRNVTLLLNCTNNGTYHIEVNNGGTFYIYDYDNNPITIQDTSNITSYFSDGKHRYGFLVQKGAKFGMHNSALHECGWTYPWTYDDLKNAGLVIYTNNTIIENCLISNNYYGILLYYSDSNIISNNTITENVRAMRCHSTNNNSIYGNNLSNNSAGSFFTSSNYNQFHNNSLFNNYIEFDSSHYNDISNNNLKNSGGIRFYQSKNNKFNNNLVSLDNPYGINLQYSTNHELANNKIINTGIKIWGHLQEHWDSHIINKSNTVNGKPIIYWKNRKDEVVPQEAGQIILASCSNIFIEKFNINNVSNGVQFGFSNEIIIRDNNLSNNHESIVFKSSSNNIIENNICNSNGHCGINFAFSFDNTIINNTCNYNQYSGIKLSYCDNNIISNNECKINNFNGIELYYSVDNSVSKNYVALNNRAGIEIQGYYRNIVEYNTAIYNNDNGISIYTSDKNKIINNNVSSNNYSGIYNTGSDNNIIANNYAMLNNKFGICITDSNYLNISRNSLIDSDYGIFFRFSNWATINNNILIDNKIGIDINQSDGNTLYYNNFISNSEQAYDDSNNQWDNGVSSGNYWSDYNGTDANGDGIGDTPYIIDENSQDNYPLMEPWNLTIQEFKNITITLELIKSEYYVGETIAGSIHITNDNPFDIALNNLPWQIMVGIFFNIKSLNDYTQIDAVYNRNPIEVSAQTTLTIDFELYEMNTLSPEASGSVYLNLPVGNYTIFSYFYYGSSTKYAILESNRVTFRVIEESAGIGDGDGGSSTDKFYQTIIFATATGLILVIIIFSIFVTATEVGKYKFFATFVAPLYSRELKKRKKTYKNGFIRGKVLGYILGNPGENYSSIKQKLTLTNGALAYHLKVLEREQDIRSERDGMLKRFYPYEGKVTAEILELSKLQKRILNVIKGNPGISQTTISKKLNESVQRVNYHVQLMVEARLIRLERDGNKTKCYILEELS